MIKKIYSWGSKHVGKDFQPPKVRSFSATSLVNPHATGLYQKTGLDPEVQEMVLRGYGAEKLIQEIINCGDEEVGVYCIGGRHRSVAIAEEVGKRTGAEVIHLSKERWNKPFLWSGDGQQIFWY